MGHAARRERPRRHALWRGARPDRRPDGPPARIRRRCGAPLSRTVSAATGHIVRSADHARRRIAPARHRSRARTRSRRSRFAPPFRPCRPLRPGQVVNSGTFGRGSHDSVRVSVTGPSWLVLGEGYNRGWQATCDGHSLGAPVPIDGYANGWPIGPSCHSVTFTFAPNRLATIGYVVSGVAGLICLALLVWPLVRRRRVARSSDSARPTAPPDRCPSSTGRPCSPRPAPSPGRSSPAACSASCSASGPGSCASPVLALILWRGVGARWLTLAAGALLGIVVPLLYIIDAPSVRRRQPLRLRDPAHDRPLGRGRRHWAPVRRPVANAHRSTHGSFRS